VCGDLQEIRVRQTVPGTAGLWRRLSFLVCLMHPMFPSLSFIKEGNFLIRKLEKKFHNFPCPFECLFAFPTISCLYFLPVWLIILGRGYF
jgi:hypothetical protein